MAARTNAPQLKGKANAPARPAGSSAVLRKGHTPDMASKGMPASASGIIASVAGGQSTVNSRPAK